MGYWTISAHVNTLLDIKRYNSKLRSKRQVSAISLYEKINWYDTDTIIDGETFN